MDDHDPSARHASQHGPDLRGAMRRSVLRALFGTCAALCAVAIVLALALGLPALPGMRSSLLLVVYAALLGLSLLGLCLPPAQAGRALGPTRVHPPVLRRQRAGVVTLPRTGAIDGRHAGPAQPGRRGQLFPRRAAPAGRQFVAVLMDLQMPGMRGFEATALLRAQYSPLQLPVIALTAAALISERSQALAIGMTDFPSKPVDPQRLRAALLRALDAANDGVTQASA